MNFNENRKKVKPFLDVLIIVALFVSFSYIIQTHADYFQRTIGASYFGMLLYVLLAVASEVVVPVSSVPMMPLASNLWGWFVAGILSIIGWTLGASIAFILARLYGIAIINRFVSMDKISKYEKKIPEENLFWGIVFIRILLPVDVVSYVLGLFSKIDLRVFVLATAIGVTPFAFIFAYLGKISVLYQVITLIIVLIILTIGYFVRKKLKDKGKTNKSNGKN